jgi:hypothetical protein
MKFKKILLALLTTATCLASIVPAYADTSESIYRSTPIPARTVSFNGVVAGDAGLACSLFKVSIVETIQVSNRGAGKHRPQFKNTVLAEGVATGVATNQPPNYCHYNLSFAQPFAVGQISAEPSATYWQNRTISVLVDGGKEYAGKYSYQPQGTIPDTLTIDVQAYKR